MYGFNTYMTSFQEKFLSLCLLILSVAPSQAQTTLSIPDTLSGQVLSPDTKWTIHHFPGN